MNYCSTLPTDNVEMNNSFMLEQFKNGIFSKNPLSNSL